MKQLGLSIVAALALCLAAPGAAESDAVESSDVSVQQEVSVPEPSAVLLFGIGMLAVGAGLRRRRPEA